MRYSLGDPGWIIFFFFAAKAGSERRELVLVVE